MPFQHQLRGNALVCRPEGDLDEGTSRDILELAGARGARRVVMDLSGTPYLSSQGVGVLLNLQTQLAGLRSILSLASPSPLVRRILHQAGVAGVVTIHTSVESAGEEPPSGGA